MPSDWPEPLTSPIDLPPLYPPPPPPPPSSSSSAHGSTRDGRIVLCFPFPCAEEEGRGGEEEEEEEEGNVFLPQNPIFRRISIPANIIITRCDSKFRFILCRFVLDSTGRKENYPFKEFPPLRPNAKELSNNRNEILSLFVIILLFITSYHLIFRFLKFRTRERSQRLNSSFEKKNFPPSVYHVPSLSFLRAV